MNDWIGRESVTRDFLSSCLRHLCADCLGAGGGRAEPGQRAGHVPAQPALPADPADAAHGPEGGDLETAGLCHLRTQ